MESILIKKLIDSIEKLSRNIDAVIAHKPKGLEEDFTLEETAAKFKMEPQALRKKALRGEIGHYRLGQKAGKFRFTKEDIEAFQERTKVCPKPTLRKASQAA
ncbi:MAG: helix-turn-helix domain-containing protein [Candidatus Peribacteraceae bacterium]|nr:helix-turn-helix domain-containing protein [Candidatus Peribacteraceae bacterium]